MRGRGCPYCKGTGFKGRIPIGEAFHASDELLRAVGERDASLRLEELAVRSGMIGMAADGYEKAVAGLTTIDEVATVLNG